MLSKLIHFYVTDYFNSRITGFEIIDLESRNFKVHSEAPKNGKKLEKRYFAIGVNVNVKKIKHELREKSQGALKAQYITTNEINDDYYSLFEILDPFSVLKNFQHISKTERMQLW